jgi:oligopeptidase B
MKQKLLLFFFLFQALLGLSQNFEAPKAEKIPFSTFIHQDTLIDNYYWLRDKNSPEVINFLYANNTHANNTMKSSNLLQKVLFEELKNRRKENYDTKPNKVKNYYYYSRVSQEKEYPDLFRKKDSLQAPEKMVLNLNKLAEEFSYFNLGIQSISQNQELLAYGIDAKGNNVSRLYIKHIDNDSIYYADTISQVLEVLWSKDNHSFYYTIPEPKTLRSYRVYRHYLGSNSKTDELIFEELDKTFQVSLGRSASKEFILLNVTKTKSTETWYWPDSNIVKPQLFLKRKADIIYSVNHFEGNEWYIFTNFEAKNYQLMTANFGTQSSANWKSIVLPQKDVLLNDYSLTKDHMILNLTQNVTNNILVVDRKTKVVDTLQSPIVYGSARYGFEDYNYYNSKEINYSVVNCITPAATCKYNLQTKEKVITEIDTLLGKYDPNKYETKRLWAKAKDGVMVPITLYHRKGIILNGLNPTLVDAYGSYGSSSFPSFNSDDISYLDRGFVLATAHIRGGKELGEDWYENGKLMKKKNTFTDFIACSELLVKEKYTSPNKLAITGASAGGLLMGAVLNMRPDLFNCAIANVPFVDVINTMLDETIPLTTFEFQEWGNPKIKADYAYMKSDSPYDNVSVQAYPNILVTAGYNDAQVGYWEPAKWVSKLREFKTDTNLLLFKTNMDGGHGGASGKYEAMKEQAFKMAFIMQSLGVKENYLTIKGKVIDENLDPMVYASIFIEGTSQGTSSNVNGEFELQIKDVENTVLVFQTMGYIKQKVKINMNSRSSNLLVKMKSENIQLKAVVVNGNAKDPAYAIIKEAIKRRKENEQKIQSYATDVYMKSNVRLCEIPKKRPAFIPKSQMPDSNDLGLVYLSESVAKYYNQKPDYFKEEMLASKVAGEKQGFSWNRVNDVFLIYMSPALT